MIEFRLIKHTRLHIYCKHISILLLIHISDQGFNRVFYYHQR